MKHIPVLLSALGLLLLAAPAMAQTSEPTSVRLAGGAALDFNEPQDTRFGPGAGGALKLTFDLKPWLDVAPSVMTDQFAPNSNYSASGVSGLWAFGAGLRLKRPHNADDGSIWASSSPWIDADAQVVSTGNLARFGYSVGAGLAAPMDNERHWWLGPFVRWTEVVDGTQWGGNAKLDHTDASVLTVGLELEFDITGRKKAAPPPPAPVALTPETKPLPVPEAPPVYVTTVRHETEVLSYAVQFDFDSAVLTADAKANLNKLAAAIKDTNTQQGVSIDHVEVDGHASSENHPWAEKHNQTLSEKRAAAVVAYLVTQGLPEALLSAKGFGTRRPVADNKTEAGRVANRRAEFIISATLTKKVQVQ